MQAVVTAMPDWAFNITDIQEDGDKVTLKSHITGTHTGLLELPGMPPIPATGKKVALPILGTPPKRGDECGAALVSSFWCDVLR